MAAANITTSPVASSRHGYRTFHIVMAGLVPAIHDLSGGTKNVDARDKPGHDEFVARMPMKKTIRLCDSPASSCKRAPHK
jgi:hypothetical protein